MQGDQHIRLALCNNFKPTVHVESVISVTRQNNRRILMHLQKLFQSLADSERHSLLFTTVQAQRSAILSAMSGINGNRPLAAISDRLFLAQQESKETIEGVLILYRRGRIMIAIVNRLCQQRRQLLQQKDF